MKKVLVVVDMQNDFIDGALGTKEAVGIVDKAAAEIERFEGSVFVTMDTHGSDYLETAEGIKLPVPHCIKGTEGWQLSNKIMMVLSEKEYKTIEKVTFGSTALAEEIRRIVSYAETEQKKTNQEEINHEKTNREEINHEKTNWEEINHEKTNQEKMKRKEAKHGEPDRAGLEIECFGLCTDICVVSNALLLKANFPEAKITVRADCCAGVTPETHAAALRTMEMCQIEIVSGQRPGV